MLKWYVTSTSLIKQGGSADRRFRCTCTPSHIAAVVPFLLGEGGSSPQTTTSTPDRMAPCSSTKEIDAKKEAANWINDILSVMVQLEPLKVVYVNSMLCLWCELLSYEMWSHLVSRNQRECFCTYVILFFICGVLFFVFEETRWVCFPLVFLYPHIPIPFSNPNFSESGPFL